MGTLHIPTGEIKSGRILAPQGGVAAAVVFATPFTSDTKGTDGDYHIDIKPFDAADHTINIGWRITVKSLTGFTVVPDFDCAYITWFATPFTE